MFRFAHRVPAILGLGLLFAMGCDNPLNVENENDPDRSRALGSPEDVESLIRDSYLQAKDVLLSADGINMQLGVVAFENSSTAANFGQHERSTFPRGPIINTSSDQFRPEYYEVWAGEYSAIRSASDGLAQMDAGLTLGDETDDARARAFGKFVLGYAHAVLAITYDKASIYDETTPIVPVQPLVPYGEVMTAALGYMQEAIDIAEANPDMSFPEDWLGEEADMERFVEIVNSYKARYRTQVARTPEERSAVDWNAVINEAAAGVSEDYAPVDDDDRWDYWMHDYTSFKGAWHQVPYFISGMADSSGAYQAWLQQPVATRQPFVIQTADKRFPQGNTLAAQRLAPGKQIRAKSNDQGEGGFLRAERGQWRWSHYLDVRFQPYYNASNTGLAIPVITVREMDLLRAEGYIRTNQAALALPLINATRVADGGLPPATLLGAQGQGTGCVPKLPNGQCGDLLETLKWEKRREFFMTVFGGWYFDARGWGDLAAGTYIHYPVPAPELEVRLLPLYTFGGGGTGSAGVGTYGF